jgi:hypothetical protein
MVEDGRADRLTDLIYTQTPQERRLLDKVGYLFASLQDLSETLAEKYPSELARFRSQAADAAARGEADDALSRMFTGRSPTRRGQEMGDVLNDALLRVLTDPYAFLSNESGRLTSVPITDDTAALLWDAKPIFGPLVGMSLKQSGSKWQIVLPTHLAPVQRVFEDEDMCAMLEDIVVSLANAIRDVEDDVKSGESRTLEEAAHRAGEYAALPIMIVGVAFAKYNDELREASAPEPQPPAPSDGESTGPG